MSQKAKIIINFLYIKITIIFLSIFISHVNSETKIIAKKGDTLFKLSKQYGIALKELMYKNNFNDANQILEGEVIILPLKRNVNEHITYTVKEGDTLYKIARENNVNVKDLIYIRSPKYHLYNSINFFRFDYKNFKG